MTQRPMYTLKHSMRFGFKSAVLATGLLLAACSSSGEVPEYVERPVEELYNTAMDTALAGEYEAAAPMFDEVERQHPYSVWATQAQLMAAYSLYQANEYNDSVNALDRFIQLNPGNRNVDYAYYLKGLCYYEQISDVGRDQKMTDMAMASFNELIKRFPQSKYARDASIKIDLTRNHLAGKQMEIGRYYLKRGHYLAAINRFKIVLDRFDTTDQVPEALLRLTEAYTSIGLDDEANRTAAVLGYNYPGSPWYEDAYALVESGQSRENTESGFSGWFKRTF